MKRPLDTNLAKRMSGRPIAVSDLDLENDRNSLVWILEISWGEVGWNLQTAKKPENIRLAFAPISSPTNLYHLELLRRSTEHRATGSKLRTARREIGATVRELHSAEEHGRKARENLAKAESARSQIADSSAQYEIIRNECDRRKKNLELAEQEIERLRKENCDQSEALKDQEAWFSRNEVLRFVKSKHYSLTPLNLANAMAGLPYLGWRQSFKRCRKWKCANSNGVYYQVFNIFRRILNHASHKKNEAALIQHFRDSIQNLKNVPPYTAKQLRENWYFIKRAIADALNKNAHPKVLPYIITTAYVRSSSIRTNVDMILAESESIPEPQKKTRVKQISDNSSKPDTPL